MIGNWRMPLLVRMACTVSGHPLSPWSQWGDGWWHRECPCHGRIEAHAPSRTSPRIPGHVFLSKSAYDAIAGAVTR